MQPFNINQRPDIEAGKYTVQTRIGDPVRIICWDKITGPGEFPVKPIVGLINAGPQGEQLREYNAGGIAEHDVNGLPVFSAADLFVREVISLSPFEERLAEVFYSVHFEGEPKIMLDHELQDKCRKAARQYGPELFSLATGETKAEKEEV